MDERFDVPVEELAENIRINVVDIKDFNSRVISAYNEGTAEKGIEADGQVGRSIIPAATGAFRDFSYIAPDIPEFIAENCVGCMDCVTECPDTARAMGHHQQVFQRYRKKESRPGRQVRNLHRSQQVQRLCRMR